MEQLTKNCFVCNKIFSKKESTSMREWINQTKYCSYECYWTDKNKQPSKICPTCKQPFKSKSWSTKAVYCSRECSATSQSKPLPPCEVCGETCKTHARRFCSPECRGIWYKGENVYNYVGENNRSAYPTSTALWMERAEEIRQRDKVCQHCQKTPEENGRALDVHHRIPYRISRDNSPDNLIALCKVCHKKADHLYRGHQITS